MKTYRVSVPCQPAVLHQTLQDAGMRVATVRADWADVRDPVALWAVIVFANGYNPDDAKVASIIQEHLNDPSIKGKRPSTLAGVNPDKERCISALERL